MHLIDEENNFCLKLYSQGDWYSRVKLSQLINLVIDGIQGTATFFKLERQSKEPFDKFNHSDIMKKIITGKTDSLAVEGELPKPYNSSLILDRHFAQNKDSIPFGSHIFAVERYMTTPGKQGKNLNPWLSLLETCAQSLELRYGAIFRRSQQRKSCLRHRHWISPQYIRAVARVMLFGPKEVERFDREVLLAAPAHQVRELSPGYILIITSPDSLDADAPEDEKALDALADYLFAQPKVSVLM